MRPRDIAFGLLLLLAACGGEALPATTSAVEAQPSTPDVPPPPTTVTTAPPSPQYIAPADVLLVDVGFLAPWQETHRTDLREGYDYGPNQTDCPAFSALDDLTAVPSASAGWWRDGFNLNHDVYAYDSAEAAVAAVVDVSRMVTECPRVEWLEGGAFASAELPLPGDALGIEFVDDIGEVRWYALLQRANVLSRIEILSFGAEPLDRSSDLEGFAALVSTAAELLEAAPTRSEPTNTTTTTRPPATLPPSTTPPATTLGVSEADRILFGPLLLDDGDLDGTLVRRDLSYSGEGPIDGCPPTEAYATLSDWMQIEAAFESIEEPWFAIHAVGFPDDGVDPSGVVEAVAGMGTCDFGESEPPAVSGPIDDLPEGATAGSYFAFRDERVDIVVGLLSMDDGVVSSFTYAAPDGVALDDLNEMIDGFTVGLPAFREHVEACTEARLRFQVGETGPEVAILERCDGLIEYLMHQAS